MDDVVIKVVTVYGPLGLGWIAFAYILRIHMALQDRVMAAFIADTDLKAQLKASLDDLKEAVKR